MCVDFFFCGFFPLEKKVSSAVKKRKRPRERNTLVARHMSAETENPDDDDRRLCDEGGGGGGGENKPSMHFIVQNVSKKHNIGTICRNCTAFDVTSMHLVGNAHYNVFGSHGSDAHVRIEHHPTLEECRETMKEKLKCAEILGVEITEESEDVSEYTFKGNTAFVLGMCVRYRSMFCCSIVVVRESFSLLFVFRDEEDRHVCERARVSFLYTRFDNEALVSPFPKLSLAVVCLLRNRRRRKCQTFLTPRHTSRAIYASAFMPVLRTKNWSFQ